MLSAINGNKKGRGQENINKMKRQPSEWEKIFANEATDKF